MIVTVTFNPSLDRAMVIQDLVFPGLYDDTVRP